MKSEPGGRGALAPAASVFFGGCLGAGARAALGFIPAASAWPWTIFSINLSGAFLLGLLDAFCASKAPSPRLKALSSFVGTGVMGAFTTYGTFVDQTRALWLLHPYVAIAYALSSLVAGVFLAGFGLWLGRKWFKK